MTPGYETVPSVVDISSLSTGLKSIFEYWEELREQRVPSDGDLPSWRQFDWGRIPAALIPWCTVVDVERREPMSLRYRFWGSNKVYLHGVEYTGISITDISDTRFCEKNLTEYAAVFEKQAPLLFNVRISSHMGVAVDYPCLRLPFAVDGRQIDKILGVSILSWSQVKTIHSILGITPKNL